MSSPHSIISCVKTTRAVTASTLSKSGITASQTVSVFAHYINFEPNCCITRGVARATKLSEKFRGGFPSGIWSEATQLEISVANNYFEVIFLSKVQQVLNF